MRNKGTRLIRPDGGLLSNGGGIVSPGGGLVDPVYGSSALPVTAADYVAIGFPAPDHIWDCQVADVPLTDLVGSIPLADSGANSDGLTFQNASTFPNGETFVSRTTVNTSRTTTSSDVTFLDVGTTERVAVGMLIRQDASGTSIVHSKRSGQGWKGSYAGGTIMNLFGRPVSGGDINLNTAESHPLNEWHYVIWIIDRDAAVELAILYTNKGQASADISSKGTFTIAVPWGLAAGAIANQDMAAAASWEGAKVASLTAALPQAFLDKVGV